MTISSAGIVTFKDDILIKDGGTIGVASAATALTISSAGNLTVSGTATSSAGELISEGTATALAIALG